MSTKNTQVSKLKKKSAYAQLKKNKQKKTQRQGILNKPDIR